MSTALQGPGDVGGPLAAPAPGMFNKEQIGQGGDARLAALVQTLDIQAEQPAVVRLREWSLAALDPRPGETAVDVGSGTGSEVLRLAELVGPSGRALGVEPNHGLRGVAQERAASAGATMVSFVDGEAAALPFDSGSVDVLRCERVLQHLDDPQAAVDDFARVLRPGGRVAILDSDWGTVITHPGDPQLLRRYAESNWSRMANPFSGRHLANQLRSAGLDVDLDIGSSALIMPPLAVVTSGIMRANAEAAVADGHLTRDEVEGLVAEVTAAAEAGTAFMSVTMFAVVGRKPA